MFWSIAFNEVWFSWAIHVDSVLLTVRVKHRMNDEKVSKRKSVMSWFMSPKTHQKNLKSEFLKEGTATEYVTVLWKSKLRLQL